MLLDLVQHFLRATVSFELAKFNTMIVSIMLKPVRLGFFTTPSTIEPSLHRLKASIFKHVKPQASFSSVTWSSAPFLTSYSEPWTCGNFNALILPISLQPVQLGFFKAPSTIEPSLHRLKASVFKHVKPQASFLSVTWSSAPFLTSYSEPWTCGNFNALILPISLQY